MTVENSAHVWVPLRPGLFERDADGGITLTGNRCDACETTYFPTHPLCVRCLSDAQLAPVRLSRRGTVYTYTTVYQSTPDFKTPYVLAYVDLPEGVRVLAQLEGVAPEAARIGLPVELVATTVSAATAEAPEVVGYRFWAA